MDFERTFDNAAAAYDRARPEYPDELYRDLLRYRSMDERSRALEIGVGTGKASAPILATGCSLIGIEPGETLAAMAREKLGRHNNFSLLVQTLQESDFPPESFDLIYAATAFHWIPEEYGYPKVYELLRHGGVFARFAYHAAQDSSRPRLAEEIQELYDRLMPRTGKAKGFGEADAQALAQTALRYGFADAEYHLYRFPRDFTAEGYMLLLSTYPDHMNLEAENRERLFRGIYDAIERHGGVITVNYIVDLELARKE
ncbi:MAG: class I SAM-dependent methyltransferase [Ruminococcaceae bacterium]|nr:class I SAM-dependent methyltransferase [Oscillospiraceae bacterium]